MTIRLLALLSPAKKQQPQYIPNMPFSKPQFIDAMHQLAPLLKKLTSKDLSALMHISDKLGALNYARFQSFNPDQFSQNNASPAISTFQGDAYQYLDAFSLPTAALLYLQEHLYIISGLYGFLRPFDLMQLYRLEMKTRLAVGDKPHLVAFWKATLTQALSEHIKENAITHILNCASKEYSDAIDFSALAIPTITCQFKQHHQGQLKSIGIYAKQARGLMIRYCAENRVNTLAQLQQFNSDGYVFDAKNSTPTNFIYIKTIT